MSDHSLNCPDQNLPPRDAAVEPDYGVYSAATSAAAAATDLWAGYTADPSGAKRPSGKVWIEVEALGATIYVRFVRTNGIPATTTANGAVIVAGDRRRFYLDPEKDLFVDHIASGAGTIKWRKVGQIVMRSRA